RFGRNAADIDAGAADHPVANKRHPGTHIGCRDCGGETRRSRADDGDIEISKTGFFCETRTVVAFRHWLVHHAVRSVRSLARGFMGSFGPGSAASDHRSDVRGEAGV